MDEFMADFSPRNAERRYEVSGINLPAFPPQVFQEENEGRTPAEEEAATNEDEKEDEISDADKILILEAEIERLRTMVSKQTAHKVAIENPTQPERQPVDKFDVDKVLDEWNVTNSMRRAMIKLQLRPNSKKQQPYSMEKRLLAILWHYHSASAYERGCGRQG